jgi:hypothetical protein
MAERADRARTDEVAELLAHAGRRRRLWSRLGRISQDLVGRPYLAFPLGGGPTEAERLVSRLDAFDCVTYVETVLALAFSRRPEDFETQLARLRYEHGRIDWFARNHYMSLWMERNAAAGRVAVLDGAGFETESRPRTLSSLAGFPPIAYRLRHLPPTAAARFSWADGDVLLFVSHRRELDFFHTGVLVRDHGPLLRHASRSRAMVVEEPLADFVARSDPAGVCAVRPIEPDVRPRHLRQGTPNVSTRGDMR